MDETNPLIARCGFNFSSSNDTNHNCSKMMSYQKSRYAMTLHVSVIYHTSIFQADFRLFCLQSKDRSELLETWKFNQLLPNFIKWSADTFWMGLEGLSLFSNSFEEGRTCMNSSIRPKRPQIIHERIIFDSFVLPSSILFCFAKAICWTICFSAFPIKLTSKFCLTFNIFYCFG